MKLDYAFKTGLSAEFTVGNKSVFYWTKMQLYCGQ
jgi:hypothetical protein